MSSRTNIRNNAANNNCNVRLSEYDRIGIFGNNGRVLEESEIRQRRAAGMCPNCGVRTHIFRVFRRVCLTNDEVENGECRRCSSLGMFRHGSMTHYKQKHTDSLPPSGNAMRNGGAKLASRSTPHLLLRQKNKTATVTAPSEPEEDSDEEGSSESVNQKSLQEDVSTAVANANASLEVPTTPELSSPRGTDRSKSAAALTGRPTPHLGLWWEDSDACLPGNTNPESPASPTTKDERITVGAPLDIDPELDERVTKLLQSTSRTKGSIGPRDTPSAPDLFRRRHRSPSPSQRVAVKPKREPMSSPTSGRCRSVMFQDSPTPSDDLAKPPTPRTNRPALSATAPPSPSRIHQSTAILEPKPEAQKSGLRQPEPDSTMPCRPTKDRGSTQEPTQQQQRRRRRGASPGNRRRSSTLFRARNGPNYEVPLQFDDRPPVRESLDRKGCFQPAMLQGHFPYPTVHEAAREALVPIHKLDGTVDHEEVFLIRNTVDSKQAYRKLPHLKPIPMKGHLENHGEIVFCVVLPRISQQSENRDEEDDGNDANIGQRAAFKEPDPNEYLVVAVKKYRRWVVDRDLEEDEERPNPYNEASIMQLCGGKEGCKSGAALQCIEALIDHNYFYIVCPYMGGFRTVQQNLQPCAWNETRFRKGWREDVVKPRFRKLVMDMICLQKHRVCHRNLSPETVLHMDDFVLDDFTRSLQVPFSKQGRHFVRLRHHGRCGQPEYMAPEVYKMEEFDGYAVDVWGLGTVLFAMLTGRKLYHLPYGSDQLFSHFITHQGLIDDGINKSMLEMLEKEDSRENELYLAIQTIQQELSKSARQLLFGMLHPDPTRRLTLSQILAEEWWEEEEEKG